ncbi:MAG: hypothetical protein LBE17_08560, partial [Treponema sp.]|nr:hypothetical protein [Treponema sp.]
MAPATYGDRPPKLGCGKDPMTIPRLLADARKIIFKFGSNTLADQDGRINPAFLEEFAGQAGTFVKTGKQIVIVSSGA